MDHYHPDVGPHLLVKAHIRPQQFKARQRAVMKTTGNSSSCLFAAIELIAFFDKQ
jgi:hypothetical protein